VCGIEELIGASALTRSQRPPEMRFDPLPPARVEMAVLRRNPTIDGWAAHSMAEFEGVLAASGTCAALPIPLDSRGRSVLNWRKYGGYDTQDFWLVCSRRLRAVTVFCLVR
jgi:hypothetical protein